uniref:Uncharacterized protein n=1 Tax=Palpitomonas bilix TaxID=652834 RepID=A0A7S3G5Z3_9EUKA|mmetsp:Transcript_21756/g.56481  ORF Transcript_21756/g.56481 Transcript_21756/m.56481 type:complete len:261 (+) Transcript_21756:78-860(+)
MASREVVATPNEKRTRRAAAASCLALNVLLCGTAKERMAYATDENKENRGSRQTAQTTTSSSSHRSVSRTPSPTISKMNTRKSPARSIRRHKKYGNASYLAAPVYPAPAPLASEGPVLSKAKAASANLVVMTSPIEEMEAEDVHEAPARADSALEDTDNEDEVQFTRTPDTYKKRLLRERKKLKLPASKSRATSLQTTEGGSKRSSGACLRQVEAALYDLPGGAKCGLLGRFDAAAGDPFGDPLGEEGDEADDENDAFYQ